MKKILMIAMMALPVAAFSQTQMTNSDATSAKQARPSESVESIYVELIVSYNDREGQIVKTQLGNDVFGRITDKESLLQIKELSEMVYKSVPDAMAHLTSMNFKFLTSYELSGKDGKSTAHLIFEKRTLGKAVKEDMERQNAKSATGAPKK